MISSISSVAERGLDTMVLVYSLLQGHPASLPCEQFLRNRSGWFVVPPTLFEAKAILTKVYGVKPADATVKMGQLVQTSVAVLDVDKSTALAAMHAADSLGVDLNDAVLLHAGKACGAVWLATDDAKVAQVCSQFGLTPENPIDPPLRQQIAAWELAHLAPKGVPRILRQIHQWLSTAHSQVAQDFWTHTGGGSHLP